MSDDIIACAVGEGGRSIAHVRAIIQARADKAQPVIEKLAGELTEALHMKLLYACEEHLDLTNEKDDLSNPIKMIERLKVGVTYNASSQTYAISIPHIYGPAGWELKDDKPGMAKVQDLSLEMRDILNELEPQLKEAGIAKATTRPEFFASDETRLGIEAEVYSSKHLGKLLDHLSAHVLQGNEIDVAAYRSGRTATD